MELFIFLTSFLNKMGLRAFVDSVLKLEGKEININSTSTKNYYTFNLTVVKDQKQIIGKKIKTISPPKLKKLNDN
jgi:hypothetical protein